MKHRAQAEAQRKEKLLGKGTQVATHHPGVELRSNLESISHKAESKSEVNLPGKSEVNLLPRLAL